MFILIFLMICGALVTQVLADEYEDERLYMLVSPDHHTRTPRLEDFFWTGSGDGPPPPDLSVPLPTPSTPVVRTTTVLATVYLDSYPPQAVTDKTTGDCVLNCDDPSVPGSLEPDIPDDRRYWLLTVIQGTTPDSLQLKLARLYQKAFLRQQEKHLGIIKSLDAPTSRKKHDVHSFAVNKYNSFSQLSSNDTITPVNHYEIESSIVNLNASQVTSVILKLDNKSSIKKLNSVKTEDELNNIGLFLVHDLDKTSINTEIKPTTISESESWILVTPTAVVRKRDVSDQEVSKLDEIKEDLIDLPLEEDTNNETLLFKREIIKPEQQPPVHVHIQNITESPDTGSVQIVYVVLVGGRAVPAAVAARDMRLVRDAEVARELGAVVTTKAEPYLKAAEGLEGEVSATGVHGTELWALAVGGTIAVLLLLVLMALLCLAHRKKSLKSAESLRAYRNEMIREAHRNQLKHVHDEKDGKLISVVSPSRTRPSSTLLPIYRSGSASGSSTTSSGISEVAAALRRRQKKPHALRMPQKKRVGTTDSLLEAAGLDSSDSGQPSAPQTPTSYLSMPSVVAFPRGNVVEPLSRILEPVSVRHLDIDSPTRTPKEPRPPSQGQDVVPRRQMASQLVRLGSIDKDPGVIGPLVWDLHCQRIKDASKPSSPAKSAQSASRKEAGPGGAMRRRFNELMDDAFTLFGSAGSSRDSRDTYTVEDAAASAGADSLTHVTQARNDNVRLPGNAPPAAARGKSANTGRGAPAADSARGRPRTSCARPAATERRAPAPAWPPAPPHSSCAPTVSRARVVAEPRLPPADPALPLISAIKSEIQRIRENAANQKPSI